jgi:tRNA (guanine-N7-)-methyltransferase
MNHPIGKSSSSGSSIYTNSKKRRCAPEEEEEDPLPSVADEPPSELPQLQPPQPPQQQQLHPQQQQLQPITVDGIRPQKRFYRQRAHCNPLAHNDSYEYPIRPSDMNWSSVLVSSSSSTTIPATAATATATATGDEEEEKEDTTNMPPQTVASPPHSISSPPPTTTTTTTTTPISSIVPTVLDIGCGFGGLTLALAALLPGDFVVGMEIRAKVTEYVRLRIVAAQQQGCYTINPHALSTSIHLPPSSSTTTEVAAPTAEVTEVVATLLDPSSEPHSSTTTAAIQPLLASIPAATTTEIVHGHLPVVLHPPTPLVSSSYHHYQNCTVLRTNAMKFLPHYFAPHSIRKLFCCFPDPHFKRKNYPRRIISYRLLDEYAYILQLPPSPISSVSSSPSSLLLPPRDGTTTTTGSGGQLYCITDVLELHQWHLQACDAHPLFRRVLVSSSSSSTSVSLVVPKKNDPTKKDSNSNNSNNDTTTTIVPEEDDCDPCLYAMKYLTEEGQKVDRNHGNKYYAIYERIHHDHHHPTTTSSSTTTTTTHSRIHAENFFR